MVCGSDVWAKPAEKNGSNKYADEGYFLFPPPRGFSTWTICQRNCHWFQWCRRRAFLSSHYDDGLPRRCRLLLFLLLLLLISSSSLTSSSSSSPGQLECRFLSAGSHDAYNFLTQCCTCRVQSFVELWTAACHMWANSDNTRGEWKMIITNLTLQLTAWDTGVGGCKVVGSGFCFSVWVHVGDMEVNGFN